MDRRGGNLIEALDRVEKFLELNAQSMGAALTPIARERFSAMRTGLEAHMKSQDGSGRVARSRTEAKRELRAALITDHLRPIAMMARSELELSPTPAAFTIPRRNTRYSSVVAAGYGLAEAAAPNKAVLVAGGLREDFIEQLIAATDALRDAGNARSQVMAIRIEATAMLRKQGRLARRYLRALDSVVRSAIKPDQELFDRWVTVSRVASEAASAAARVETEESPPTTVAAVAAEQVEQRAA